MHSHLEKSALLVVLCFLQLAGVAYGQLNNVITKATGEAQTIFHDGLERNFRIHVPDQISPTPSVVIFLHGRFGTAAQASKLGLTEVADKHGFIVVYPNGINMHWNDGRKSCPLLKRDNDVDDVGFIAALSKQVAQQYQISNERCFLFGLSNGGFMCQRLAVERPELFAATGMIGASMPQSMLDDFSPSMPVSMIFFNGTDDPIVPYSGGELTSGIFSNWKKRRQSNQVQNTRLESSVDSVGNFSSWKKHRKKNQDRDPCASTESTVQLWLDRNGLGAESLDFLQMADTIKDDGCHIERHLWTQGEMGTAVALYKIVGGGHNLPGMKPYLPKCTIGKTNRDIDGWEIAWDFFDNHGRRQR